MLQAVVLETPHRRVEVAALRERDAMKVGFLPKAAPLLLVTQENSGGHKTGGELATL